MRSEVLIAFLISCAGTPTSAGDPWLVVEGVNGMYVSSDARTLTCAHGQCSIWEETRYASPQPDGALSLRDLAYYDCAGGRTRTQVEIKFGVDGRILTTVTAAKEIWSIVQPDSVGATSLAFACNFRHADADDLRAGAFDVAGEHFVRLAPSGRSTAAAATHNSLVHGPQTAVQIAAVPSETAARNAVATFKRQFQEEIAAGLKVKIEPARLKGADVFRVLVEGFADDRDAQAFCIRLRASGDDCFTRSNARSFTTQR